MSGPRAVAHWRVMVAAVRFLNHAFEKAAKAAYQIAQLTHYFPYLAATVEGLTDPKMKVIADRRFPMKPAKCEHPPEAAKRYGNGSGRYRQCEICGSRWKMNVIQHPNGMEVAIAEEELVARPKPHAKVPAAKSRAAASSSASSASQPPSRPSRPATTRASSASTPQPQPQRQPRNRGPILPQEYDLMSEEEENWDPLAPEDEVEDDY